MHIAGHEIPPGHRKLFDIPVARLPTDTWLELPVIAINGRRPGPRLFLSAAVHGDELNGLGIIQRVVRLLDARRLAGAVIAVPVVNVFGFVNESRYLPDRRDLNRSFPGSPRGSLAARLAHLFMTEIAQRCQYGIDLHTGSFHRTNLPQVRANLRDPEARRCAEAFGAPIMLHSRVRDGSLRQAATERGIHVILYEAGEAGRFHEEPIAVGVSGVLRVMRALGMWDDEGVDPVATPLASASSHWVRARRSGILLLNTRLGRTVAPHEVLGVITDAFGTTLSSVRARTGGLVIGHTHRPLVNQGDALVHVAESPGPPDETLAEALGVRDDLLDVRGSGRR